MLTAALLLAQACALSGCTAPAPPPEPIAAICSATDGDTLRCGDEKIRLLAIDAPEMPGHCRKGRICVEGDPKASRAALALAIEGQHIAIRRMGMDRYGRTLAVVFASGKDLSCLQLAGGHAVYVEKWDNRGAVRQECPTLAGS